MYINFEVKILADHKKNGRKALNFKENHKIEQEQCDTAELHNVLSLLPLYSPVEVLQNHISTLTLSVSITLVYSENRKHSGSHTHSHCQALIWNLPFFFFSFINWQVYHTHSLTILVV